MKRKSIRAKIHNSAIIFMAVALLIVGLAPAVANFFASKTEAEKTFAAVVESAATAVELELKYITSVVRELGTNPILTDDTVTDEEITAFLADKTRTYGYVSIYVTDTEGMTNTGVSFAEYDFFQQVMRGQICFTSPMITREGDGTHIIVAAPIWQGGISNTEIVGTVCAVIDGYILTEIINSIHMGKTGSLYLIDNEGYTIADVDYENVMNRENSILQADEDPITAVFAEADQSALNGTPIFTSIRYDGTSYFLYSMPFGAGGWAIGGMGEVFEYIDATIYTGLGAIAVTIIALVIAAIFMNRLAKSISHPIVEMAEVSKEIAMGNFDVSINHDSNDEIGDMANSFKEMVKANSAVIFEVGEILGAMRAGDFTRTPREEYRGAFVQVRDALNDIVNTLGHMIYTVRTAADQVGVGAGHVADAACSLSQGTAEQAATLEQLAATSEQISNQVRVNAEASQDGSALMGEVLDGVEESNNRMVQVRDAMHTISKRAEEINDVIKLIDDIAFQTNILALNAAIEAAHASAAGKGFSVVADEVRTLAEKVANSVKSTAVLIDACHEAISEGVELVNKTANELESATKKTEEATERVNAISEASVEQSHRLNEANTGVEQLSKVVQSNSAIAEESAAASEELSAQAQQLQQMLARFKI